MTMTASTPTEWSAPEPRLLRLMEQLYVTRSVTRSALALGQSQPTVSIWLGRLRRHLGDPLFVRTPAGMLPTPRTEALMPTVRDVLAGLQQLAQPQATFEPALACRHFRICMTDASHVTLLPQLLAQVRALAPGVSLEAAHIGDQLAQALQTGEADLALGFLPWLDSGFYQQTLYAQDWICLVNRDHPRIGSDDPQLWNLATYQSEAHIGIRSGTGQHLLDQAIATQQLQRRLQLALPGFLGLSAVLSSTDLVATLPRHIGETLARTAGLRVLPCPVPIAGFSVKQYWHARYHHDSANQWLRSLCAQLFMRGFAPAHG